MKKSIIKIFICILAVSALLCALAIMASAEAKPIYISKIGNDAEIGGTKYSRWKNEVRLYLKKDAAGTETAGVFNKNADFGMKNSGDSLTNCVFIPIDGDVSAQKENLVESGLFYEFDASTGKMTITGKIKKQSDGKDVPWIMPAIDGVISKFRNVEFAEETGITRIPDHCFNNCQGIVSITVPSTLRSTENESIGRIGSAFKTFKVIGSELDAGTIDLRTLTSYDRQTFHTSLAYGANIYIGEAIMNSQNLNLGGKDKTYTYKVYAPRAEVCLFATSIATGITAGTKYTVEVYPTSFDSSIKQLGYQVRTASYNGFRSRFVYQQTLSSALVVAEAGVVLDTPKELPFDQGYAVETGVIVGTKETFEEFGYKLTKSGNDFVTANEKIKKVKIDPSKIDEKGHFYVTVTKFKTKDQMEKKIAMCGYEIFADGSVAYGTSIEPASIYDTTIGLYRDGLINKSIESDGVFWSVLDKFKVDMNSIFDGGALKPEYSRHLVLPLLYTRSGSEGAYIYKEAASNSNYDKTADFKFKPTADGDLYWDTEAGKKSVISFFKLSDDSYIAIAHLTDESYTAYKADPSKTATFYGGDLTKSASWTHENFLSKNIIGIGFKTLILDDGFGAISGNSLKGLGTYSRDTYFEADPLAPDGYKAYPLRYYGELETIIYPESLTSWGGIGNQTFHSDYNLKTIYKFGTNKKGVSECEGIADISNISAQITANGDCFGSYFNGCKVEKVNLPLANGFNVTIGKGMFQGSATIAGFLVDGKDVTGDYEEDGLVTGAKIDFTGTGYIFKNDGVNSDYTKAFEGSSKIKCIINNDGAVNVRTSGNTWETTPAVK